MQQDGRDSIIDAIVVADRSMHFRRFQAFLAIAALIVALSGCVYRMDIPQGNRIDPALVEQLEIGMSRNQVEFLLGTPAIVDLYRPDEWYYVYYLKTGDYEQYEKRIMKLTFSDNLLSNIDGTINPG